MIALAGRTVHAQRHAAAGVDLIVAQGTEAGGHIGELTTMTLIPQIADAVQIPVVAAGGIADGRGIAAAMMLGAKGVQCGTRFLCAEECQNHMNYKEKVLKARDIDTVVTGRRLGHPVRCIKSPLARAMGQMEYDAEKSNEDLERFGAGSLRRAAIDGDLETGSFMAGQSAALVKCIQPAREIIEEMFSEAEALLREGSKWA